MEVKAKRKPFIIWKIGEEEYRLKLNRRNLKTRTDVWWKSYQSS